MAIVTSAQTSATRPATIPAPISTMSPRIGSTSARTLSGFSTIDMPKNIMRKPPSRTSHVIIELLDRAASNISAESRMPFASRSTFLPVLAV